jgi:hAT family C-terminal dimerisation region
MEDSDSSNEFLDIDPSILASVTQGRPDDAQSTFPTLHLWALDILAIPAMSAECERVFSSTKKLITPERTRLSEEPIEASEYLKN